MNKKQKDKFEVAFDKLFDIFIDGEYTENDVVRICLSFARAISDNSIQDCQEPISSNDELQ